MKTKILKKIVSLSLASLLVTTGVSAATFAAFSSETAFAADISPEASTAISSLMENPDTDDMKHISFYQLAWFDVNDDYYRSPYNNIYTGMNLSSSNVWFWTSNYMDYTNGFSYNSVVTSDNIENISINEGKLLFENNTSVDIKMTPKTSDATLKFNISSSPVIMLANANKETEATDDDISYETGYFLPLQVIFDCDNISIDSSKITGASIEKGSTDARLFVAEAIDEIQSLYGTDIVLPLGQKPFELIETAQDINATVTLGKKPTGKISANILVALGDHEKATATKSAEIPFTITLKTADDKSVTLNYEVDISSVKLDEPKFQYLNNATIVNDKNSTNQVAVARIDYPEDFMGGLMINDVENGDFHSLMKVEMFEYVGDYDSKNPLYKDVSGNENDKVYVKEYDKNGKAISFTTNLDEAYNLNQERENGEKSYYSNIFPDSATNDTITNFILDNFKGENQNKAKEKYEQIKALIESQRRNDKNDYGDVYVALEGIDGAKIESGNYHFYVNRGQNLKMISDKVVFVDEALILGKIICHYGIDFESYEDKSDGGKMKAIVHAKAFPEDLTEIWEEIVHIFDSKKEFSGEFEKTKPVFFDVPGSHDLFFTLEVKGDRLVDNNAKPPQAQDGAGSSTIALYNGDINSIKEQFNLNLDKKILSTKDFSENTASTYSEKAYQKACSSLFGKTFEKSELNFLMKLMLIMYMDATNLENTDEI